MDGIYDDIIDKEKANAAATPTFESPYEAIIAQEADQRRNALKASINIATQVSPDKAGKVQALADRTGLPLPVVERNEDLVAQQQRARDLHAAMQDSPVLARQMLDPNFAKIAQDDAPQLNVFTKAARSLQSMLRSAAAGATYDAASGIYGVGEVAAKNVAPLFDGAIPEMNPVRRVAQWFEDYRKGAAEMANVIAGSVPEAPEGGFVERSISSGFRSTGQMAPGLAMSIATRDPKYVLMMGGVNAGSQSATKALDAGASPGKALIYGIEDAVAEVVTEKLPMGLLLKDLNAGASFKRVLAHQMATEVPTELAATAWQNANEWANLHPEKTFGDYIKELGPDAAQTVIATMTQVVLTAGLGKIGHRVLTDRVQEQQATQDADVMKALLAAAGESKVRERSPQSFSQFVANASQEGPVDAVYVNAAQFAQGAQEAGISLETMPQTSVDLKEALATGRDVRIPLNEFATSIPGTALEQVIIPHLRTDPNAPTQQEASDAAWVEQTKAQTEKILAQNTLTDQWREMTDNVKNELLTQLNEVKRFTGEVNKAYAGFMAAFYATQAHRLGITPEEMYVRYPLQIRAEQVTGGGSLMGQSEHMARLKAGDVEVPVGGFKGEESRGFKALFDRGLAKMVERDGKKFLTVGKGAYYEHADPVQQKALDGLERISGGFEDLQFHPASEDVHEAAQSNFTDSEVAPGVYDVPLDKLAPLLEGYDTPQESKRIAALAEKIKENEAIDPVFVAVNENGDLTIAEGQHRVRALIALGYKSIPARLIVEMPTLDQSIKAEDRTIEVDGVRRPITNSNGQLIAQTLDAQRAFWKWFGDSKVVDEKGRPLVVYHGTASEFDAFDPAQVGSTFKIDGAGFFFTSSQEQGEKWADSANAVARREKRDGSEARIVPVYLSIQNPWTIDADTNTSTGKSPVAHFESGDGVFNRGQQNTVQYAVDSGYDGLIVRDSVVDNEHEAMFVAFNPEQIKSAVGNRGTFDGGSANILDQSAPGAGGERGGHASTRVPFAKGKEMENPISDRLQIGLATFRASPKAFDAAVKLLTKYVNWRPSPNLRGPEARVDKFIDDAVDNLLWLYDQVPEEIRQRSKLWYVGANNIANSFAAKRGITLEQSSAVIAVNSPQTEWFTNISRAERILDMWFDKQDQAWTPEMSETTARILSKPQYAEDVAAITGRTLAELKGNSWRQAMWMRVYDESHNLKKVRIVSPEGALGEFKDAAFAWANFDHIAKSIHILEDASAENISAQLGEKHKVRSFYNNIFDPDDPAGDVTIDTHAVAAALLRPLSGKSVEVMQNFGAGVSNAQLGIQGTYGIYAEAYRRAAAERGVLPREMQSITWEAIRGMYTDVFKRSKDADAVENVWAEYKAGKLDEAGVRAKIHEIAGGINEPNWHQSDSDSPTSTWSSSYGGELLEFSPHRGSGPGASGDAGRSGGSSALGASNELNQPTQEGWDSVDGDGFVHTPPSYEPGSKTRGSIRFTGPDIKQQAPIMSLLARADLSTFLHESGHFYLEVLADMARQENAPQEIIDDFNATMKWFGVTAEQWANFDMEQKRAYHEKWARGFEAYLFEGKAPATELTSLFGRFRAWMINVYRQIAALNVTLNDEVRAVFDRLIATNNEIDDAEAARAYAPIFEVKPDGVTDDEWKAYQEQQIDATQEAVDQLQTRSLRDMQWLTGARSRALKNLQKQAEEQRQSVRAEVAAEVDAQKIYVAARGLRNGWLQDDGTKLMVKFNTKVLKELYPEGMVDRPDLDKLKGMTNADTGLHPDEVAGLTGFDSGDDLIRKLVNLEPRVNVIEGITDQRMLERYGDLADARNIEKAANEAVHNEVRARVLATELAMLSKATGDKNLLNKAAKAFAIQIIGRQAIKDLKPHIYAAAEARAGRAAEAALKKNDIKTAAAQKRTQVVNMHATKAAYEAQTEVRKGTDMLRKVLKGTNEDIAKTRDVDVVMAARAVLAEYGIGKKGKAAQEYLAAVKVYDPGMYDVLRDRVDALTQNAKPLDQLTVDEFRALRDEIGSMMHLARRSRQMEVDGDLMDRADVQDEIYARMEAIGIPDKMPGSEHAVTDAERRLAKFQTARAALRRVESWVGVKDGKELFGPFRKYVWSQIKDAADLYRSDKAKALKTYRAMLDAIAPSLKPSRIAAPELGYTFGFSRGGSGTAELLHAILHTGNASNKRKLLLGRKWATEDAEGNLDTSQWDAFVTRMIAEKRLTKEHFDFAQAVWDMFESTKPLAQKTHRDVFGYYFAEITAEKFTTPFGEYAGGYVPAIADPEIVTDAKTRALMEEENQSMQFAFPSTNKGFTKGRVEYNRPLLLDLRVMSQHLDKVLLFSHLEQPVRDVRRVLTSKKVAYALNRIDPAAFDGLLTPWLNRVAQQQVETPVAGSGGLMRLFSVVRSRAGMAAMFGNLSNTVQQITGLSTAAVKVPPKYLMSATADFIAHPREFTRAVSESSVYMNGRMENEVGQMTDAINDILLNPNIYEKAAGWTAKHSYFLQSAVDNVLGPIVWTGAYNHALETLPADVKDEQRIKQARRLADGAVRETQGAMLPEEVSRIETGNAFVRLFTQFAGYFNTQANMLGTEFAKLSQDIGLKKGAGRGFYILLFGFLAPAWVAEFIAQAFKGGPDDEDKDGSYLDDWLAAVFGFGTLRYGTAMVPIIGQVSNAAVNTLNKKPYDDRISTAPAISMIESAVSAPHSVYKAIVDDGKPSKAIKDVAALISLTLGVPASFLARPISYAADTAANRVTPTSPVDAARGVVTGIASPESKNR